MGDKTTISWVETRNADGSTSSGATWNPLLGCSKISSGCTRCFAVNVSQSMLRKGNAKVKEDYAGLTMVHKNGQADWSGVVRFLPDRLLQPMKWARPRRIFVNSLSDCFHPDVKEDDLDAIFCVMAMCPQHTFMILTKRPERMQEYFTTHDGLAGREEMVMNHAQSIAGVVWDSRGSDASKYARFGAPAPSADALKKRRPWPGWPLQNVWLGTSIENQDAADERIPHLLRTPAAARFLSAEPLIAPLNLRSHFAHSVHCRKGPALGGPCECPTISWCIVGGESGPGFRPMPLEWARDIQRQCKDAGVKYFFKQTAGIRSGMGEDALGEVIHEFPDEGVHP